VSVRPVVVICAGVALTLALGVGCGGTSPDVSSAATSDGGDDGSASNSDGSAIDGASQNDASPGGDGGVANVTAVSGLMMRAGNPPYPTSENYITSSVLAINWTDIETAVGSYDFTIFDTQLAGLTAKGVTDIKVRVFGGDTAPTWIKKLGGPPSGYFNSTYIPSAKDCSTSGGVSVENVQTAQACIPFFWTTEYQTAYDSLMGALAHRLDGDATKYAPVTTIVDSSCMAVYAEVFYRGQGDGATNHTLIDAGLTGGMSGNDWACQAAAVATHARYFKGKRRTAIAINDWDMMNPSNSPSYRTAAWQNSKQGVAGTWDFLKAVAEPMLGTDLELQNNGLHSDSAPAAGCAAATPDVDFFCYLKYYPYRHGFQTQSYVACAGSDPATPCSASGASQTLLDDLNHGILMNAQFIELPSGMSSIDWSLMKCFNDQIVSGSLNTNCPQ
jgi:hypothetical protein